MKHVIFTLSLLALMSCKDTKQQETSNNTDVVEDTHKPQIEETASVYANAWTNDITLNEGQKWTANTETNEGVERMKTTIKTQPTNTLEEYYNLAELLNKDKNYVIKNCTMKGDSHDNLHVWLLPLMDKIDALSETQTLKEASKLKHSITENINAYDTYFQ
ncbi:hypothetical protein [Psychroserpens mesophilus]|uniref:hypothetical protein n=1 Tax=Psychroserpens mesophilus TaxID=325473 RepID=UPI003D64829A